MAEGESAYWFKPKHHGYGATPTTWQGWLVTTVFAIALGLGSVVAMLALRDSGSTLGYAAWFIAVVAAVYAFTRFARRHTDGEWAWRWKGQKYADVYDPEKQQRCE
ncbi:MAG: hypothetical protein H6875_14230 [Hyphomicrobiaceae bacterium]|nr:hypothetical protein [Hyphomicrobiaceae bacterium]